MLCYFAAQNKCFQSDTKYWPLLLFYTQKSNTTNNMVITVIHSLCQVLAHQQMLSAILSFSCVHLCFLICVLFFSHHLVACSFFNNFTLASLSNLSLFFSPTSRLFIHNISKFCYFFMFLSLKAVTSFLFLKPKNLILTSLSIATCSPLLLKIYSLVRPQKLANKVSLFHLQLEFVH